MQEGVTVGAILVAPAAALPKRGFLELLWLGCKAHGVFFVFALTYLLLVQALVVFMPGFQARNALDVLKVFSVSILPLMFTGLLFFKATELFVHHRPKHPTLLLVRMMWDVLASRQKMAAALPMVMALFIFNYDFAMIKANITTFQPFAWDVAFDRIDTALHLGYRPWEVLQPIFGYAPITLLLNLNYNLWFFVMILFWVYYAVLAEPGERRTHFFLAFMSLWLVGGGLLAVVFSSAGPCFYGDGRLGLSPDPYAPLMAYLREVNQHVPIWAVATQDILWSLREQNSAFGGVSAMPSMHNGTTLLFLLASRGFPRAVRLLLLFHAVFVFIGSIALGWHYAIDSYLAWIVALAAWWAMKPVARWWEDSRPERAFRAALGLPLRTGQEASA